jgi:5-methylcytosine-specific restriction endonuclease McrA
MTVWMQYLALKECIRYAGKWSFSRNEFSSKIKRQIIKLNKKVCAANIPGFPCEKEGKELKHYAIDHIVPSRAGGPASIINAQILCLDCHAEKSLLENEIFPKKNSVTQFNKLKAKIWIKKLLKISSEELKF